MKQCAFLSTISSTPSREIICTNFKPLFTVESAYCHCFPYYLATLLVKDLWADAVFFKRLGMVHSVAFPEPNTCQIFGACCLGMSIHQCVRLTATLRGFVCFLFGGSVKFMDPQVTNQQGLCIQVPGKFLGICSWSRSKL